jgi:DNA-binding PadR family transcriptional regulator
MPEHIHHTSSHSPEFALLGFLYNHPNHGYNLHRQLESELGYIWHVSQSQSYAILKRLLAQGAIHATTQGQAKLPPRQVLQITDLGRHRFEEWTKTPSGSSVRAIRLEFISRLYFARKHFPELLPEMFSVQSG